MLQAPPDFQLFSTTNNINNLNTGSTVEYSAAGNQNVVAELAYSNLTLSGSGIKTIYTYESSNNLVVNDALTLAAGTFTLNGKTLTLNGTVSGAGTITGSSTSNLTIGGSSSTNAGTLNFTAGAQNLNLFTLNRPVSNSNPSAVLGTNLSAESVTLSNGILATGNNLFTWNNNGGTFTAPEPSYTYNSTNYTKSFIATCNATGTPVNVADSTTRFTGTVGFRIKNIGASNIYFPVAATFLPAQTGGTPSPNRLMVNNQFGSNQDFTVVVNYGDIGYTDASITGQARRVNRIWYINNGTPKDSGKATIKLFFTNRDFTNWGAGEDEIEAGFVPTQAAIVQKDYSGNRNNFINLSYSTDLPVPFSPSGTEMYAQYTINGSNHYSNGIIQFNRFSVVNPGNIILPVSFIDFTLQKENNAAHLKWTTANEINVSHYEAERSFDGFSFSSIGTVSAKNNISAVQYDFIDGQPLKGNGYYRIKAVDKNGSVKYTAILMLNFSGTASITIAPNPVRNHTATVQFNNAAKGSYKIVVYNSLGQFIFQKEIVHAGGSAAYNFYLPLWMSAGIYHVSISNGLNKIPVKIKVE